MPIYIAQKDVEIISQFSDLEQYLGRIAVMNKITQAQVESLPEYNTRGVTANTRLREDYEQEKLHVGWIDRSPYPENYWVKGISFRPDKSGEHFILDKECHVEGTEMLAIYDISFLVQDPRVITDKRQSDKIFQQIYKISDYLG